MSKLNYEDNVKIYQLRKQRESAINLSKKYNIRRENVNYMVRIIAKHRLNIFKKDANRNYTKLEKNGCTSHNEWRIYVFCGSRCWTN